MDHNDLTAAEGRIIDDAYTAAEIMPRRRRDNYVLHIGLFLLTFLSVTYSAAVFTGVPPGGTDFWSQFGSMLWLGLPYSILLIFFLSAHEFGHYFAARSHNVDATLPYYIPMPFIPFGTLGAVIRTRSVVPSRRAMFDIGVAGPLAGFVVALAYLVVGMLTMPGIESLYAIHPEYRMMTQIPDWGLHFGGFLLLDILREILVAPGRFFPPMNEIYHYPFLCIGWFGMFVTALNMLPVGQLDGGHVVYAMFGRRQPTISRWFMGFILFAGFGSVAALLFDWVQGHSLDSTFLFFQGLLRPPLEWLSVHAGWWLKGWLGWLLWYAILRLFIRVKHPPTPDETPLDRGRMIVGWVSLAILVLTFSFTGVYDMGGPEENPAVQIPPPAESRSEVRGVRPPVAMMAGEFLSEEYGLVSSCR